LFSLVVADVVVVVFVVARIPLWDLIVLVPAATGHLNLQHRRCRCSNFALGFDCPRSSQAATIILLVIVATALSNYPAVLYRIIARKNISCSLL